jgi:hypothetical protein
MGGEIAIVGSFSATLLRSVLIPAPSLKLTVIEEAIDCILTVPRVITNCGLTVFATTVAV